MSSPYQRILRSLTTFSEHLPEILAESAREQFVRNFDQQSFEGRRWQEVQRRTPGTSAYRYGTMASRTNPILQGKGPGRLRHSIRIRSISRRSIQIQTTGAAVNQYAGVHNYGKRGMPKRTFMSVTPRLRRRMLALTRNELRRALRIFL